MHSSGAQSVLSLMGGSRLPGITTELRGTGNSVDLKSPKRDQFSWAAVISQHTRCGQSKQALQLYDEMREGNVRPSSYALVAALKACSSLQDLDKAKQIDTDVVKHGYESDVYLGTMLVDVYAKCRSLMDARRVFDRLPHHDVVSWTTMIMGYAQMEEANEALRLYTRMQEKGLLPSTRTFVAVLKACSSLVASHKGNQSYGLLVKGRCLEQVKAIHSQVLKSGIRLDVYAGTMLIDVYLKCGSLLDARHVFDNMPRRDLVSWTAMILGYAQMEEGLEALRLYAQMQEEGLVPDARAFVAGLKACSSLLAFEQPDNSGSTQVKNWCLEQARAIHTDVVKLDFVSIVFVGTMLVDVYAKCGSLVDARHVFEKMPHRNVVSWTAMILGYAQMGEGEEALHLYMRMRQEGVVPDARAFVGALKACSSLAEVDHENRSHQKQVKRHCLGLVQNIHSHIIKSGFEADIFVGNMLLDAYAKSESLVDARLIFNRMPHHNVVSWSAIILGYAQMEEGDVALELYAQMQEQGVAPNDRTFVGALQACGSVAGLEKGKEIHSQISKAVHEITNSFVASSLVDMYAKCGSMEDAQRVFDELPSRTTVTWNALIAGYSRQGETDRVFHLFEMMQHGGVQPTLITFLSVLTVCSHVGLVDKGRIYFESMSRDFGIGPTIEHYSCMADLFGRAGYLEEAFKTVRTMPFPPDSAVWRIVLAACCKWRNVELGRKAFEYAVRLDKNDSAAYVMMSNIYATAHMMECKKEIQAMRVKSRAWKKPGQSRWTDMRGVVHAFVAGDRVHPESQAIYSKVVDLSVQMKAKGYIANLDSILRDIPDDEKEDALCEHSERLAIAYALLKTPEGTTIRVVKDLRVCEDCHAATALISQIVQRTIICRDASRFHVYKDGRCSCGNYW